MWSKAAAAAALLIVAACRAQPNAPHFPSAQRDVAPVVGAKGRVLAEDIQPEVRDALSERVEREKLDNVAVKLGTPDNPMLPAQSFDRIFLVHMYHEVQSPYAFLWHAREGLKPGGEMILVDSDRPVRR